MKFRKFLSPFSSYEISEAECAVIEHQPFAPERVISLKNVDIEAEPSILAYFTGVGSLHIRSGSGDTKVERVVGRRRFIKAVRAVANDYFEKQQKRDYLRSKPLSRYVLVSAVYSSVTSEVIRQCAKAGWHRSDVWASLPEDKLVEKGQTMAEFYRHPNKRNLREGPFHLTAPVSGKIVMQRSFGDNGAVFAIQMFENEFQRENPTRIHVDLFGCVDRHMVDELPDIMKGLHSKDSTKEFANRLSDLNDKEKVSLFWDLFLTDTLKGFSVLEYGKDISEHGIFFLEGKEYRLS